MQQPIRWIVESMQIGPIILRISMALKVKKPNFNSLTDRVARLAGLLKALLPHIILLKYSRYTYSLHKLLLPVPKYNL